MSGENMSTEAFYDERLDRMHVTVRGQKFTLNSTEVHDLLDAIEHAMYGPSLVADHRGD
jgi:hypothetical protein